jgi:hypothetical protein
MDNAIYGSAKAWARFNGVTTVTIAASYNISSITRNSSGDYTFNFTNAFIDTNYSIIGSVNTASTGNNGGQCVSIKTSSLSATASLLSTTQVEVLIGTSGSVNDAAYISFAVFR